MAKKRISKNKLDKSQPELVSYGDFVLPPVVPGVEVDNLCKKIDSFYKKYSKQHKKQKASDLIKGAFYAMRSECRSNTDWMSQAAGSARDVLYPLFSEEISGNNLIKLFKKYAVNQNSTKHTKQNSEFLNTFNDLDIIYQKLSDLTHHGTNLKGFSQEQFLNFTEKDFQNLITDFTLILGKAFNLQQIYVHTIIDMIVNRKKKNGRLVNDLKLILKVNSDARYYFYSKADKSWLNWLWKNKFFQSLKKKAKDTTKYSYSMPELEYLTNVADKSPAAVAKILLEKGTATTESNLNPEILGRFLWITGLLPAKQIKMLLPKMIKEEWTRLMSPFHGSGYEYIKIREKLEQANDFEAINQLAKVILASRSRKELDAIGGFSLAGKLFYLSHISETGVFNLLLNPQNDKKKESLDLILNVISGIVSGGKDKDQTFKESEPFYLLDADIFTIEVDTKNKFHEKDDIENLIAVARILIDSLFTSACNKPAEARKLYDTYIAKLPDSRTMYKLRLYAATRCPELFRNEIKELLFRIFEVGERYFDVDGGAEYHSALIAVFGKLENTVQREYIQKIFEYFGEDLEDKDKKQWRRRDGLEKLLFIKDYLTAEEIKTAEKIFGKFPKDGEVTPHPDVMGGEFGFVSHKSPVNLSDFSVRQIIGHLKDDWTPEKLKEQFKGDNFLSPRGTEGLAEALKENFKKRPKEYLESINDFFERDVIHSHYVYFLLRGLDDMLRNNQLSNIEQVGQILGFFEKIKDSGEKEPFRRVKNDSWLVEWVETHSMLINVLLLIINNKDTKKEIHNKYRGQIKELISYLLTIKDSPSKENEKPEYGEPYGIAINSVRGRAFEAFVVFTENDGNTLDGDGIKELYKKVLLDDSIAVRFVIGRYLASFYFRDKDFIRSLLPEIFPKDNPDKKDLYLASWEGYLSNTLYDKLFVELGDYYKHAITLNPEDYTQRKYLKGLDETLAVHIALAFAHLGLNIEDELFVEFWQKKNKVRHGEFISFIGRSCLTRSQAGDVWLKENNVSKEKLVKFWGWTLDNTNKLVEPESLSGFGFWVNPDAEILDDNIVVEKIADTLKKSGGNIDWDYGLLRRLPTLAKKNGGASLEITTYYLLNSKNELNQNRRAPLLHGTEIKDALAEIYKNGDNELKQKVVDLINMLIEKGSSMFWGLKTIIE